MKEFRLTLLFLLATNFFENGTAYMVDQDPYHHVHTLDPKGRYQVEWRVDLIEKSVTFNVTVATRGYVGFGLSANGRMAGADIVVGGVRSSGAVYFSDKHGTEHHSVEDDSSQDWHLNEARESQTHTFLSFTRLLDTCDPFDYPITDDKVSLIWSYGERDEVEYHHQNRGVYQEYLLTPDYTPPVMRDGGGRVKSVIGDGRLSDLKVWTMKTEMVIPEDDTTYWCQVHEPPRLTRKHHIVGFEVRFPEEESRRFVHHIAIHKCHAPVGTDLKSLFEPYVGGPGQPCLMLSDPVGPIPTQYCTEFFMAWAIGSRLFFYPPSVGFPLREDQDEYFIVQHHYDNPNHLPNVNVHSEFDFMYTGKLRENDAGLIVVRTPSPGLTPNILVPPSTLEQNTYAHCSPECTRVMLPKYGINVASVFLHAHNSGRKIRLQHFRGSKELPWILHDDNYGVDYQPHRALHHEVRVFPGDQLTIQCSYDNTWTNGTVVAGFSTRQEMCVALIMYFNKLQDYNACNSQIISEDYRRHFLGVTNITWDASVREYRAEPPSRLAGLTITEISDNLVEWNLDRRAELQRFHLYHPQINTCPKLTIDPDRLSRTPEGEVENEEAFSVSVVYPVGARPYQPPESCSFRD